MKFLKDYKLVIIFAVVVVATFAAVLVLGSNSENGTNCKELTSQQLQDANFRDVITSQQCCIGNAKNITEMQTCIDRHTNAFAKHNATQNTTTQSKSVTLTRLIDSSCTDCLSLDIVIGSLKRAGVEVGKDTTIDYNSAEGAALIQEYGIKTVPVLILSREIENYTFFMQALPTINATHKNGNYVLHEIRPPYKEISTGKVLGLVRLVFLNDSSCRLCYDVLYHRQILAGYGIFIANETLVDVNSTEGKALISRYNIKAVPTFLLSPDAKYYTLLMSDWNIVGSVVDEWYIFTNMTAINAPYRNLENGVIIFPAG